VILKASSAVWKGVGAFEFQDVHGSLDDIFEPEEVDAKGFNSDARVAGVGYGSIAAVRSPPLIRSTLKRASEENRRFTLSRGLGYRAAQPTDAWLVHR
jgi:hypothetical protein